MSFSSLLPRVTRHTVIRARATVSVTGAVIIAVFLEQDRWNSSPSLLDFHGVIPSWPVISLYLLLAAVLICFEDSRPFGYALAACADAAAATSLLLVSLNGDHANIWAVVSFFQTACFQGFGVLTAIQDRVEVQGGE